VEYIIEYHMGTLSGLESRAMEKVFRDNHDVSLELLLAQLDIIGSLPVRNGGNIVYFLGKLEDSGAREPLERLISPENDSITEGLRVGVIKALGSIGDPGSLHAVISLTADSSERIRRECAVTLGAICSSDGFLSSDNAFSEIALETLNGLAADMSLAVRSAAERSLRMIEDASITGPEGGN
jgi:HEAT repeat protein